MKPADLFGLYIRNYRRAAAMTQRDLAQAVGVSFTYISKIENNKIPMPPSTETIERLASVLAEANQTFASKDWIHERLLCESNHPVTITVEQWRAVQMLVEDVKMVINPPAHIGQEMAIRCLQYSLGRLQERIPWVSDPLATRAPEIDDTTNPQSEEEESA